MRVQEHLMAVKTPISVQMSLSDINQHKPHFGYLKPSCYYSYVLVSCLIFIIRQLLPWSSNNRSDIQPSSADHHVITLLSCFKLKPINVCL